MKHLFHVQNHATLLTISSNISTVASLIGVALLALRVISPWVVFAVVTPIFLASVVLLVMLAPEYWRYL